MSFFALPYEVYECEICDVLSWLEEAVSGCVTVDSFRPFLEMIKERLPEEDRSGFRLTPGEGGFVKSIEKHLENEHFSGPELAKELSRLEDVGLKCMDVYEIRKTTEVERKLHDFDAIKEQVKQHSGFGLDAFNKHKAVAKVGEGIECVLVYLSTQMCRIKYIWGEPTVKMEATDEKEEFFQKVTVHRRVTCLVDVLPQEGLFLVRYEPLSGKLKKKIVEIVIRRSLDLFQLNRNHISPRSYVETLEDLRGILPMVDAKIEYSDGARVTIEYPNNQNAVSTPGGPLVAMEIQAGHALPLEKVTIPLKDLAPDEADLKNVACELDATSGTFRFTGLGRYPERTWLHVLQKVDDAFSGKP